MAGRKIIVHIATSVDGYIARPDGDIDWLVDRPAPKGFYGMPQFMRTVDAKILGRKTFDAALALDTPFSARDIHYVFSRQPPPAVVPAGVRFVTQTVAAFVDRIRAERGKNVWMMGGGELIGAFLDENAIDEIVISIVPTIIGAGIPLIAPRHRHVPLRLLSTKAFPDGVVQLHYRVDSHAEGGARTGRAGSSARRSGSATGIRSSAPRSSESGTRSSGAATRRSASATRDRSRRRGGRDR
jgi:dihydrofolate reductase